MVDSFFGHILADFVFMVIKLQVIARFVVILSHFVDFKHFLWFCTAVTKSQTTPSIYKLISTVANSTCVASVLFGCCTTLWSSMITTFMSIPKLIF